MCVSYGDEREADNTSLNAPRGDMHLGKRGLAIGAFSGGLVGGVLGAVTTSRNCIQASWYENGEAFWERRCSGMTPAARGIIVGLVSAAIGGGVGYLLGSKRSGDRVQASIVPQKNGRAALTVTVAF